MDYLMIVVEWYTAHFADNVVNLADYAFIYGWLAGISGIVAIAALIAMLTGYERGIPAISMAGQHLLVLGIPFIWGQVVSAFSTTSAGLSPLNEMVSYSRGAPLASLNPELVEQVASSVTQMVTSLA